MRCTPWAVALLALPTVAVGIEVELLESDSRHAVIEITPAAAEVRNVTTSEREYVALSIPGFGFADDVGRPEVPVRSVRVALPPGTKPRLTVRSVEWSPWLPGALRPVPERVGVREPFGPHRVEEQEPRESAEYLARGTVPSEPFALADVASIRHVRTASIVVHGAQADPFRRRYRLLRRAVLEVRFEPDHGRGAAPLVSRPAPIDARWSRAYRRAVVNGEGVRSFARAGLADGPTVGDTPFGSGDQWKIVVRETGLVDVSYETLAAAGFPAGEPVDHLALAQRGFDLDRVDDPGTPAADLFTLTPVPCEVIDVGADGTFDAGDAIRFWGRSFRDQWMTSGWEHEDRFSTDNVVWLAIDPAGGARIPTVREGGSLSGAPGDSLASTPHSYFREWDRKFYRRPRDFGPGRRGFESDFFFWNDSRDPTGGAAGWVAPGPDNGPETFEVFDVVPGSSGSMTVRVVGGGGVDQRYTNRFAVTINDHDPPLGERQFYNRYMTHADSVLSTFPVPPGVLTEGENEFRFTGWTYNGFGTSRLFYSARFFFDWYEVTWARRLVARDDRLTLTTADGTAGNQIVRVVGFTDPDLALYDVTDPADPRRVDLAADGSQVVDQGGTFDLLFDHDNAVMPGAYVAVQASAVPELPASQVERRPETGVLAGGVGAQYVVVPHEAFDAGAAELADYRSATYSTHVAAVDDVYDVFGNGQRSPRAIKGFSAYAFHRWSTPIEHLCLIGDGSEDTRGVTPSSMPDFIPSHGVFASYEGAYDVSDQYYCEVTRGTPADADGFDDLADFHVGRLPVSDPEELEWNLQRIREYEAQGKNQLWRRRVMLNADDAISGDLGGGFGTPYGFRSIETLFREHSKAYAESLRSNHSDQVVPVTLYVSDWTSSCPDSCYFSNAYECEQDLGIDCGFWYDCRDLEPWSELYLCMKANTSPALLAATREWVDRGVLLWNYQGHANRYWMAHEETFRDDVIGSRHDVDTLTNEGKPFVFLGWACHLGEYDTAEEGNSRVDDCMSEKMMNVRQAGMTQPAGAVAVFSSSGFEFLNPNIDFNRVCFEEMFPKDGAGPAPSSLGEALTLSRLGYQLVYPLEGNTRQAAQRYLLFGDPALEFGVGTSPIHVTMDGVDVRDGEIVPVGELDEPVEIVARSMEGSGVTVLRLVDSNRGEIPAEAVRITGTDPLEITYRATLRRESYDLSVVAVDAAGRETDFTLGLRADFALGGLAVYPNPFADVAAFYYDAAAAETVTLHLYTISGRKIREISEAAAGSGAIEWDGRDAGGQPVANGTYLARFVAQGPGGSVEETTTVVRMR